ncbi:hypothetical protein OV090_43820 [Nannocystis sp. RBIL2]|uniref:hypothetical protein n=1 Tax=Nannocystis sp. RBIL2 TaxID=2996788 RepID=UPI00226E8B89|nr:hypothetical protein [Nannocystis sp. RBIL2]MCY1071754.1 hypothetical protein [Nannocystis sp. RBIL2]
MLIVFGSMPSILTSMNARLKSLEKRTCPCARWPAASRAARLCDGVLERNCLGVVAGVFSSSSPSWCGVKKAS